MHVAVDEEKQNCPIEDFSVHATQRSCNHPNASDVWSQARSKKRRTLMKMVNINAEACYTVIRQSQTNNCSVKLSMDKQGHKHLELL